MAYKINERANIKTKYFFWKALECMTFIVISVIIMFAFVYFMPKKLSRIEMYTTSLFAVLFAILTDLYLDVKYHLYWYITKEVEWRWMIILLGGKPPVNLIFLNFFPFHSRWSRKTIYILFWALFLTLFELGTVHIGKVLHYGEWNIWLSALLYPFILLILYLNCLLVKYFIRQLPISTE